MPEVVADYEGGGISTGTDINFLKDFVTNYEELLEKEIANAKQHQKLQGREIELLEKEIASAKQYQKLQEREIDLLKKEIAHARKYQNRLETEIDRQKCYQSALEQEIAALRQDLGAVAKGDKEAREQANPIEGVKR